MTESINLIEPKNQESPKLVKWRKIAKTLTTVVLAGWVIFCAGFLGWRLYVNTKTVRVSTELTDLMTKVTTKSKEEIIVRKLEARTNTINDFLDNRGDVLDKIDTLLQATPEAKTWDFDRISDTQVVEVQANSPTLLEEYTGILGKYYSNVKIIRVDKISVTGTNSWTMEVSMGGLVK